MEKGHGWAVISLNSYFHSYSHRERNIHNHSVNISPGWKDSQAQVPGSCLLLPRPVQNWRDFPSGNAPSKHLQKSQFHAWKDHSVLKGRCLCNAAQRQLYNSVYPHFGLIVCGALIITNGERSQRLLHFSAKIQDSCSPPYCSFHLKQIPQT